MIHPSLRRRKPVARKSRPRQRRKGRVAAEKREADRLFSLIVRARGSCEAQPCTFLRRMALQCAHGFSRRYQGTRWDERNAFCLCAAHHYRYTLDPIAWDAWMWAKLGDKTYEALKVAAQIPTKWTGTILVALRARAKELGIS